MKRDHPRASETILNVWVQPNASRNEVLGLRDGYLRIRVAAPPRDGKANQLLQEILSGVLGVAVSQVEVLSGHKSRRKRVRVIGALSDPGTLKALGIDQEKTH